jgi:alpha-glucosidase (family GH31 glycosyl hydrolase)
MSDYKDFTVDQTNFGDLGTYLKGIKESKDIKFIPIVSAGIAQRTPSVDNYTVYNDGVDQGVFIDSGAPNKYNHQV